MSRQVGSVLRSRTIAPAVPRSPYVSYLSVRSASSSSSSAPSPTSTSPSGSPATPISVGGPQNPAAYCAALVQRLDPEAWLQSYFWPKREREWWLGWRAFNLELHMISTSVSQPALAAIRFQFWRDALAAIFSKAGDKPIPQHPVAVALADLQRNRPVQKYYLGQMIDTRAKLLSQPPSSPSLEQHLSSHAPLSTSLLLGPLPTLMAPTHAQTSHISHTLSHIATLLAAVSLLRNLPLMVSQKRQVNLPSDVCAKHGVVEEQVLRKGSEAKGVRDACFEIGTRGMDELITARRDLKGTSGKVVPKEAMPLFLSAVPAESYLQRLEKLDFDVFSPELQKADWKLAPRIWWRFQTGKL